MNFFFKKIFRKIKAYFYYLINKNSRKYFFILILRKILNLFNNYKYKSKSNFSVKQWCEKKKILEVNFYKKIELYYPKNFFKEKKSYFMSAKLKEKNLNYKMGGMAHLNLIYNLVMFYKPKKILETGVAFGWSTLVFIITKSKYSKLTSVDLSYPTKSSNKLIAMALPSNFKKKFKLLMGIDYFYLKSFKKDKINFDFIHYDSDKSYMGRKKNYDLIWKILSKNGCFISDDISDNSAFYEFVTIKKINYHILKLDNKYVGIVFK